MMISVTVLANFLFESPCCTSFCRPDRSAPFVIATCVVSAVPPPHQAAKITAVKAGLQASLLVIFDSAMFRAWPQSKEVGLTSSNVVKCANYKNGDFQCNAAMSIFKALKVPCR